MVYPKAEVQTCIVHMVRASLNYVGWKQRKQVAADLRKIYQAASAPEAASVNRMRLRRSGMWCAPW